jgi:hypothetical protein
VTAPETRCPPFSSPSSPLNQGCAAWCCRARAVWHYRLLAYLSGGGRENPRRGRGVIGIYRACSTRPMNPMPAARHDLGPCRWSNFRTGDAVCHELGDEGLAADSLRRVTRCERGSRGSGRCFLAHLSTSTRCQTGPAASLANGSGKSGRLTYLAAVRSGTFKNLTISAKPSRSPGRTGDKPRTSQVTWRRCCHEVRPTIE